MTEQLDVYIIKNIFSEEERKWFIECSKPLFVDLGEKYPGKQTHPTIHLHPDFISGSNHIVNIINDRLGLDVIVDKGWINYSNGDKNNTGWHNHPNIDYAAVYYLKTTPFFNSGTLFRDKFVRVPQNGLLVFPAKMDHSAPSSYFHNPFRMERYTWALDLNRYD